MQTAPRRANDEALGESSATRKLSRNVEIVPNAPVANWERSGRTSPMELAELPIVCTFVPRISPIGASAPTVKSTCLCCMFIVTNQLPYVRGFGQNGTARAFRNVEGDY